MLILKRNRIILETMFLDITLLCVLLCITSATEEQEVTFCQFEAVNATCRPGNVVIMETAKYGRMKLNRCVTRNYGNLGCQADVKSTLEGWCSGAQGCAFKVSRVPENNPNPCPIDFASSLTLRYTCLPVENVGECHENRRLSLNNTSGYLSSYYAYRTNVGTHACPVFLQALPGQKINLTLFTYIDEEEATVRHEHSHCSYHLNVFDDEVMHAVDLCDDTSPRNVFNSTAHSLRLHFTGRFGTSHRYLIHYTVTGCANLRPPGGAVFVARGAGQGLVRCKHTAQEWPVTCLGSAWLGKIGSCDLPKEHIEVPKEQKRFSISVVIAILCGLFLGIIIGIILLILVCLWRKRHALARKRRRNQNKLLSCTDEPPAYDQRHAYSPRVVARHACQATHCDGRCVAPTTYCGRATIYTRAQHAQDMALQERVPNTCQYHTLSAGMKAKAPIKQNVTETPLDYNEMTSSLLPPNNTLTPKKTTTFSTFKPPPAETDADIVGKYGTNLNSKKGILRHRDSEDTCTCPAPLTERYGTSYEAPVTEHQCGAAQPDVILSNKENERLQLTYTNTRSMSNPDQLMSRSYEHRSTERLSQF